MIKKTFDENDSIIIFSDIYKILLEKCNPAYPGLGRDTMNLPLYANRNITRLFIQFGNPSSCSPFLFIIY